MDMKRERTMVEISPQALSDLRTAFEQMRLQVECYLDTETGKVLWFSDYDAHFDGEPAEDEPEWVHRAWRKRMRVWKDDRGRYLEVPPGDMQDNCRDMKGFLEQCDDQMLCEQFEGAAPTRHMYKAFVHTVERDPMQRRKWMKYREKCLERRIENWLDLNGYEMAVEEDGEGVRDKG